ncbi:MAG: hypothetical protein ACK4TI_05725 [Nitrososphaerales archaeon]
MICDVNMSVALSKSEKKRFLKALEKDEEFRFAVAGLLGFSEILRKLDVFEENQEKMWQNQEKLWIEVKGLRESQEDMLVELRDLRVSVERLTLSVEDEARDVIRHRLKAELNIDIPLDRVWVDEKEVNVYGASDELCVVGEATVRLGVKLIDELEDKIDLMRSKRPDLLKPKLIKVVYADYAVPSALEYAKAKGIWVLKWSGDLTPRSTISAT